jgi:hypothetical protein
MTFAVVLKSLKAPEERIVLSNDATTLASAQQQRRNWRKVLGNKNWTVERRPGLDTLDHLTLSIENDGRRVS